MDINMLLVDSNEDVIFVTSKSCLTCLQVKNKLTILQDFGEVERQELVELKKELNKFTQDVKIINVNCECNINT